MFRLFLCHKMADRLAGVLESRIIGIHPDLRDNGDYRSADKASFSEFLAKSVLKIITDISLAHSHTDGERSVGLIGIFPGKSSHCIVDHSYLGTVAMDYYKPDVRPQ